jgi:probable phosphoglycerate mutase
MVMKRLFLVRHGNTFEAGETPVYVGAATDLALTIEGRAQAQRVGDELKARGVTPTTIVCGPLLRQRQSAEELVGRLGLDIKPREESLLCEIHYGTWEGLSEKEITTNWPKEFDAWTKKAKWPEVFNSKESEMLTGIKQFLNEAISFPGDTIAVTSNGVLRVVYSLLSEDWSELVADGEISRAKVKTGAYCILEFDSESWRISEWNVRPKV